MDTARPRFFEPDDLPTAGGPVGEGPFYQDDRRDRPLYDTEVREGEDDEAVPDEEAGRAQGYSNHEDNFDSDEFREP